MVPRFRLCRIRRPSPVAQAGGAWCALWEFGQEDSGALVLRGLQGACCQEGEPMLRQRGSPGPDCLIETLARLSAAYMDPMAEMMGPILGFLVLVWAT